MKKRGLEWKIYPRKVIIKTRNKRMSNRRNMQRGLQDDDCEGYYSTSIVMNNTIYVDNDYYDGIIEEIDNARSRQILIDNE